MSERKSAKNHNNFALVLSFVGVFIAASMTIAHLTHTVLPCGASSGCEKVASDPSSYLAGVPVSAIGLLGYLLLAGLTIARSAGIRPKFLAQVGLLVSLFGMVVSLLLTRHSVVEINALCMWCLSSAATMSVLFMCHVALVRRKVESLSGGRSATVLPLVLISLVAIGLIGTNGFLSHREVSAIDVAALNAIPLDELVGVDARSMGNSGAPVTLIEFADLSCDACRVMHGKIMTLMQREKNIRLVFHHLPFTFLPGHQLSDQMAVISEGAKTNEEFFRIIESIYSSSKDNPLSLNQIRDKDQLAIARARVDRDIAIARRLKIDETPKYIFLTKDGDRIPARVFEVLSKLRDPRISRYLLAN